MEKASLLKFVVGEREKRVEPKNAPSLDATNFDFRQSVTARPPDLQSYEHFLNESCAGH